MRDATNRRLILASMFFCLCLGVTAFIAPSPAQANHCWMCAIDYCISRNFGMTECTAIPLESCELSGNFCFH